MECVSCCGWRDLKETLITLWLRKFLNIMHKICSKGPNPEHKNTLSWSKTTPEFGATEKWNPCLGRDSVACHVPKTLLPYLRETWGEKKMFFAQLQSQPPVNSAQTLASCHRNRQVRKSWFFSLLPHSSDTRYLPTGSGKHDDLVKDAHCCPLLPTAHCLHREGNGLKATTVVGVLLPCSILYSQIPAAPCAPSWDTKVSEVTDKSELKVGQQTQST